MGIRNGDLEGNTVNFEPPYSFTHPSHTEKGFMCLIYMFCAIPGISNRLSFAVSENNMTQQSHIKTTRCTQH